MQITSETSEVKKELRQKRIFHSITGDIGDMKKNIEEIKKNMKDTKQINAKINEALEQQRVKETFKETITDAQDKSGKMTRKSKKRSNIQNGK